jgi:hypothetical protein
VDKLALREETPAENAQNCGFSGHAAVSRLDNAPLEAGKVVAHEASSNDVSKACIPVRRFGYKKNGSIA